MASELSRMATSNKGLADIRLEPIKLKATDSVVLRAEMEDVVRQLNEKLQKIQQALNEVASVVKTKKETS